jgi:probable HAF family extracellular repeat protein
VNMRVAAITVVLMGLAAGSAQGRGIHSKAGGAGDDTSGPNSDGGLPGAPAIEADFRGLGYLAGGCPGCPVGEAMGVSGDGSVVVGYCHNSQGFYWTAEEGMIGIGDCQPLAASYDGSVIVGVTDDWEAFYWTEADGLVRIGDLPGGGFYSIASDVSDDGSVIIGQGKSSNGSEGFRWTSSTGMQGMGDLPGGVFDSRGFAVSPDGSIVVGQSVSVNNREAFLWSESTGMVGLGTSPQYCESAAYGITEDGSIIVSIWCSMSYSSYLWAESTGMLDLGHLPDGWGSSWARDVSADGSVIVGCSQTALGWEAFIWDRRNGMRNLREVLENDFGLDLGGWTLTWAKGISADGNVIVGRGENPEGNREGWVVTFSVPTIEAEIDIVPKTLNLRSRGKWITCHIRLADGCDVRDIDPDTILLNAQVRAAWSRVDKHGQRLTVRFIRSEVQQILEPGEMLLSVRGSLVDGTPFEGTDTIRVIDNRADINNDGVVNLRDFAFFVSHWLESYEPE